MNFYGDLSKFILQLSHCDDTPMQYTAIFTNVKMKNSDIFLIFAQNIEYRYRLEPTIYVLEQK